MSIRHAHKLPVTLFVACVLLASCAPNTASQLRDEAAGTLSLDVEKNYQAVYRDLRAELQRCFNRGAPLATQRVDSELYTDIQQGELTVGLYASAIDLYLLVDLFGVEPNLTHVEIRHSVRTWERYARRIGAYLTDGTPICD